MDLQRMILIVGIVNDIPCLMTHDKVISCLPKFPIPVCIAVNFKVEFGNLETVLFMSDYLRNAFII